jgi:hypothetical protein
MYLFHYHQIQDRESVALLPIISNMLQHPSAADWMLISGTLPFRKSVGVNQLCGMP